MSVPVVKLICSIMMAIIGLIFIKKISGSNENLLKLRNLALMLCLIILPGVIYNLSYSYIYSIVFYIITIITYKQILNISYTKATVSCGIMLIYIAILDFLSMCFVVAFIPIEIARNTWYMNIIINVVFCIILLFTCYKTKLGVVLTKLINKISEKKQTKIVIFFILILIAMSIVLSLSSRKVTISEMFSTNFLLFIIFFLLIIILFTERNSYDKLSDEYDSLFEYVKIFEDWIEKERFIRHEYKNQLAVLFAMTKEKKVKDKINSIIDETIDIDKDMIQSLTGLPNGGLKGLLYYKIAVAKKKKVNIEIDVNSKVEKLLKKLDDNQITILSKLIGVYCDNAIEASLETKKKIVSIEIYSFDKKINIAISNTFDKNKDITNRNEKGFSTKGEGRGNGLYYATKILNKNKWIKENQKIVNDIYIEKLEITL